MTVGLAKKFVSASRSVFFRMGSKLWAALKKEYRVLFCSYKVPVTRTVLRMIQEDEEFSQMVDEFEALDQRADRNRTLGLMFGFLSFNGGVQTINTEWFLGLGLPAWLFALLLFVRWRRTAKAMHVAGNAVIKEVDDFYSDMIVALGSVGVTKSMFLAWDKGYIS